MKKKKNKYLHTRLNTHQCKGPYSTARSTTSLCSLVEIKDVIIKQMSCPFSSPQMDTLGSFLNTLQPHYNAPTYNVVFNITRPCHGSQIDYFDIMLTVIMHQSLGGPGIAGT